MPHRVFFCRDVMNRRTKLSKAHCMPRHLLVGFSSLLFAVTTASAFSVNMVSFSPLGKPAESFTSTQGHKLALRRWEPSGTAKAKVILQHGGGFHSGYFGQVGDELSGAGYEVLAMDAMGHGHSEGPGGLTHWSTITHVQDDVAKLLSEEKKKAPVPIILLGESMGALITAPLVARENSNIDGAVFCGSLFDFAKETAPPAPLIFLLQIVGKLFPAQKVSLSSLDETFDSAFGDQRWADAARADPLIATDSFFLGSFSEIVSNKGDNIAWAKATKCPMLLMHSKQDTRTDCAAAISFFDAAPSEDKELKLYDDASHQLFQDSEQNNQRAIADLRAWLEARFP